MDARIFPKIYNVVLFGWNFQKQLTAFIQRWQALF
jgi:hypothetical protein